MDGFCRGCLIKYDEPTDLLQYTEKNRRLFVYSTGLQVKRNDSFTFQLCKDCYLNMKIACKFKKQCRTSDKMFKNYLALKEVGGTTDLCTFLKNHDESFTFRLPMNGSSTPAYRKKPDDDNESTCTSIRNFMADIMKDEEIPDTEARIIREVIEEEADVLDDSLDSHWLQDDVSIDTDFRLDFSFSPFSASRSAHNDHYTPNKVIEQNIRTEENVKEEDNQETEIATKEIVERSDRNQCSIDRNLEEALKDANNKEFSLDDLLVSPPVYSGISAPPTPTITNILFGETLNLDDGNVSNTHKAGQCIEKFDNVRGDCDILEEFFNKVDDDDVIKHKINVQEEIQDIKEVEEEASEVKEDVINEEIVKKVKEPQPPECKYSLKDFYCRMCEKHYKNVKGLKIHLSLCHQIKIPYKKSRHIRRLRICDECGKEFMDLANFLRHLKLHTRPNEIHKCSRCTLEFSSQAKLNMHMRTHVGVTGTKNKSEKHICNICGKESSSIGNLKTHMRRHLCNYTMWCELCNKGFYRTNELIVHMRTHTGLRPFQCQYCPKSFPRRDSLNRHMKYHIGEKPYACVYCDAKFVTQVNLRVHIKSSKICIRNRAKKEKQDQLSPLVLQEQHNILETEEGHEIISENTKRKLPDIGMDADDW